MDLFNHQKEAVDFILRRNGSGAIFHDMGTGKTRTVYEIFSRLRENNAGLQMLVIAPLSLLNAAWREDNIKFGYGYSFNNLHENFDEKIGFDPRIYVQAINYEMLLRRAPKILESVKAGDWLCVLDESSKIKNSQSQITKLLLKMAHYFKHRLICTGTPAPNSEVEYWPQMQFVAPGLLGNSMTAFKSEYFHFRNRRTGLARPAVPFFSRVEAAKMYAQCDLAITPEKRETLMKIILPHCHLAKKKDCLDLPEQTDEVRLVRMNATQAQIYRDMEKHLVAEIAGEQIAATVALTKLIKLRQIASGFIYNQFGDSLETTGKGTATADDGSLLKDGVGEYRTTMVKQELSNVKVMELMDVIEEAGDQQAIIWINFHWEQIKVCHELFNRFGEGSVVTLSALTKDKDASIVAFRDGHARFLVAHPRSAAHGLTFVNASLQIFFSLDYSLESYEQARARTHRAGQVNKCLYVHILAKDTIDEDILTVLRAKGDAQALIQRLFEKHSKLILQSQKNNV